jgi:AraC-like DNA-binding protein
MTAPGVHYHASRIETGVIQARQAHTLRRVPIFIPTLCRVRQGEKQLLWQGETRKARDAQLILMPAGCEMTIANLPSLRGYRAEVVCLEPAFLARFRQRHGGVLEAQIRGADSAELCVDLSQESASAWDGLLAQLAAQAHPLLIEHHAEGLLLLLALNGQLGPLLVDRRDPVSARVQQLLRLDPAGARLAEALHMGSSTLRRHLASEGRSFRELLEGVRLGLALQLLQTGNSAINDIACRCGYASASRFAVRFRQHYGLSPSALRASL